MRIVLGARLAGKTFAMLLEAAQTNGQIICADQRRCDHVKQQAKELGLTIHEPMTTNHLLGGFLLGAKKSIVIDDVDLFIQSVAQAHGAESVEAIALNTDEKNTFFKNNPFIQPYKPITNTGGGNG